MSVLKVKTMPGIRKYRRDTSEVSCCLKYVIFGVNVLFWVSFKVLFTILIKIYTVEIVSLLWNVLGYW